MLRQDSVSNPEAACTVPAPYGKLHSLDAKHHSDMELYEQLLVSKRHSVTAASPAGTHVCIVPQRRVGCYGRLFFLGHNRALRYREGVRVHSSSSAMRSRNVYPLMGLFLVLIDAYEDPLGEDYEEDGSKLIRIDGDVIFGGIFPMHEQVAGFRGESPCGAVKEEKGVQRLEAMLFAIDEINNDDRLLPNTSLGALILDSCSSDTYALDQCMEFVRSYMNQDMSEYRCDNGKPPLYVPHKSVTGVIGASFSVVSIMVANILRLFKIPQLSYASTSTELSEKSRFEYFSRVVPPDNFQAQAMVEVIRQLGWKYVSTVAVEGDYGEKGIASFIALSSEYNICVAVSEKILRNSKPEDFDRIVERLGAKHNARGVILFVDEDNVRKLLQAAVRANRTGHFMWVGSDSWGAKVHPVRDQEFAAEGAITILPFRNALHDFDTYYQSLRPRMDDECNRQTEMNVPHPERPGKIVNCRNVWFREFWAQHHKCSFGPNVQPGTKRCTGDEELHEYDQEGLVPFVVDAVYAMAHGVHNLIEDECVNGQSTVHHLCDSLSPAPPGPHLLQYIRNVTFVGRQGTEIRFNADGDAFGFYNIYQYQRNEDGRFDYTLIGSWKEVLSLDINMTRWTNGPGVTNIPRSTCSDNCPLGHVRNFQEACCWSCVACREDAYVFNDTCKSCPPGWAPDSTKSRCVKLAAEVIAWDSPWAIVPLVFASVGILSTLFTLAIFIRFNRTPVIMASGRELCYVLLFGILSCYGMSFLILSQPTTWNCTYLRIGLGLCLSICYSAILTKTNRISRIFNQGKKCVKRPSYTSPESQVAIAIGITSVQLIGAIVWLVIEPPDTKEIYPYPLTAVLTCRVSTFSLMMSLVYNMVLILMCTLYAFKTRKMPANFNEAKYIGFTMYSTCIVWLAFVPIYFGTNNDYKIQIASMCMCINISATVALGCLFTPKVYLVLFQPEKNVRPPHPNTGGPGIGAGGGTGRDGVSGQRPGTLSMRFMPPRSQTMQSVTSFSRSSPTRQSQAGSSKPVNERLADDEDREEVVRTESVFHAVEENDAKLTTVPELSELSEFADTSNTHEKDYNHFDDIYSPNELIDDAVDLSYPSSIESVLIDDIVPFEVIRSISEKVTRRNRTTHVSPEDDGILHMSSPSMSYSEMSS